MLFRMSKESSGILLCFAVISAIKRSKKSIYAFTQPVRVGWVRHAIGTEPVWMELQEMVPVCARWELSPNSTSSQLGHKCLTDFVQATLSLGTFMYFSKNDHEDKL